MISSWPIRLWCVKQFRIHVSSIFPAPPRNCRSQVERGCWIKPPPGLEGSSLEGGEDHIPALHPTSPPGTTGPTTWRWEEHVALEQRNDSTTCNVARSCPPAPASSASAVAPTGSPAASASAPPTRSPVHFTMTGFSDVSPVLASEAESYNGGGVRTDTLEGGGAVNTSGPSYNPANDTLGGGAAGFRPGVIKF